MQYQSIGVQAAHEDTVVNAGVSALLGACSDMALMVRPAPGPDGAQQWADLARADVVILSYRDGLAYLNSQRGQDRRAPARLLILTQCEREWEVRSAIAAGAQGYLLQGCSAEELANAVRALAGGRRHLPPELSRCVLESYARAALTGRESDVLELLAKGCCNKLIARELGIGVGTVKTHVKGLFDKLGANARTQAVMLAAQRGLVQVPMQLVA